MNTTAGYFGLFIYIIIWMWRSSYDVYN